MPDFNISLPRLSPEDLDDEKQRRRLIGYLQKLDEQLRYTLNNLDDENLSSSFVQYLNGKASADELRVVREQADGTQAQLLLVPGQISMAVESIDEFHTRGSEISLTAEETRITTPLFYVQIVDEDEEETFSMDETGASMQNLTVTEHFSAPDVARRYAGAMTVTVGGTGADYDTLAALAEALKDRQLEGTLTVTLGDNFEENVEIRGVWGGGVLAIDGDGHSITGSLTLTGNACAMYLENLAVNGQLIQSGGYAEYNGCTFNGPGNTSGTIALWLKRGAKALMEQCAAYNAETLVYVGPLCDASIEDLSGANTDHDCEYYLFISGGTARMSGTRPRMTWGHSGGYFVYPADPDTLTPGGDTPPSPSDEPTTTSYNATASGTYSTYSGLWRSDARIRQGRVDVGDSQHHKTDYAGCAWFSASALATKQILSATLTLTRATGVGDSAAVSVRLYTQTSATSSPTISGNPTSVKTDHGVIGSINQGETASFAIPAAAAQAIAGGAGIMLLSDDTTMWMGRAYSRNYASMDGVGDNGAPVLTVTWREAAP
ncbi:MAG: hypothetical protein IKS52_04540 [Clostridia bacterium]|nr:hypothetical protein [Clostridia bacterium]